MESRRFLLSTFGVKPASLLMALGFYFSLGIRRTIVTGYPILSGSKDCSLRKRLRYKVFGTGTYRHFRPPTLKRPRLYSHPRLWRLRSRKEKAKGVRAPLRLQRLFTS